MRAFVLPTIFTAIDKFTSPVQKMNKKMQALYDSAMSVSKSAAIAGAAVLAPLVYMGYEAVKFEDRMADVAKTTGIAGKELLGLGDDILYLSTGTRTSIEGLQKISEIGGQMGITGRKGILGFTDSVNKFNVALGGDFQGGVDEAARAIGGLNVLFKETRGLEVADSITRIGSSINALSAKGVQVPEVTEFIKRVGQLPDAIKPSVQETAALGAVMNKAGITAEIASRGISDILLTAAKKDSLKEFAKHLKMSNAEVANLLNTNPTQFLKVFASSLKGLNAVKTANILSKVGIGDSGSIKVVGALSSSIERLNEFIEISNLEFTKGNSLLNEYNTKNDTMAGKIARSQNNFKALSIMIGTELLPIIGDLISEATPVIKSFMEWVRQNKQLVKTLLIVSKWFVIIAFTISGIAFAIGLYAKAVIIATTIQAGYNIVLAAFNAIMMACPLLWVVGSILILISVVVIIIKYWDSWGASITALTVIIAAFFSPFIAALGIVISLVMSFVNNWDMITKAFENGGVLAGIKAIGVALLDTILMPLQQIVELIAKVTGADWAKNAVKGMEEFRKGLGVELNGDNQSLEEPANPQQSRQQSMTEHFENVNNRLAIDINDPSGRAKVSENTGGIPISLVSTHKFGR